MFQVSGELCMFAIQCPAWRTIRTCFAVNSCLLDKRLMGVVKVEHWTFSATHLYANNHFLIQIMIYYYYDNYYNYFFNFKCFYFLFRMRMKSREALLDHTHGERAVWEGCWRQPGSCLPCQPVVVECSADWWLRGSHMHLGSRHFILSHLAGHRA